MDKLISCALFLNEQLLTIQNLDSESDFSVVNSNVESKNDEGKNSEIIKLLKTASSLNKIILSKKKNVKIDIGRIVAPEYNLENLGLSADTIKFLRQSSSSIEN